MEYNKKTEKEIIKDLIKYEGKAVAIADALTQSEVLERHGALLYLKGMNSFFVKSFTMIEIISDIWLSFYVLLIC